jgi:hypothetical protein
MRSIAGWFCSRAGLAFTLSIESDVSTSQKSVHYTIIMSGRKNSPIVLSNSESQSGSPVPAIRVGNRYQAVIPNFIAINNRKCVVDRENVPIDPKTVFNQEKRLIASIRGELARFLEKYPRATQQAENEAKRTGMHRFVKRVKKASSKQAYEWKIMLYYRGG